MDVSSEDAASPPPGRPAPPAPAVPSPRDGELEHEQARARLAAEQLGTRFRARLDRLSQQQELAIASCAYLDQAELAATLAPILDDLRTSCALLADDHHRALRAAAGSLPAEELNRGAGQFRDICDARRMNLEGDSQRLPELIELRGVIERGHAERAGQASPDGRAVALGVLQGLTVLASRLGSTRMAVGLVSPMVAAAQSLASVPPADDEAAAPPGEPDGRERPAAPGRATGESQPRCGCLDTGRPPGPGHPLIYLVDTEETGEDADDALAGGGPAAVRHAVAWCASGRDGTRPGVGLVVRGPVRSIAADRRGLDAGRLAAFARSAIFRASYDGTPRTAAVAMRAAQALEVVALADPETGGGVWIDVNPSSQRAAAVFAIEDCASDRMSFIPS